MQWQRKLLLGGREMGMVKETTPLLPRFSALYKVNFH